MNILVNLPPGFFTQPELSDIFARLSQLGTVRTASHGPLLARAVIDALDRPTPSDNTRNDRSAATPKATRGNLANAIREGGRPRWLTTLGGRP